MKKSPYDIIRTVLVTEKSTELIDDLSKYTFLVAKTANKVEIKEAVETLFDDVTVSSVNTLNRIGKKKRMRGPRHGKRPDTKRAIVTLSDGEIDII